MLWKGNSLETSGAERERTRRFFDKTGAAFLVIERVVVPEYRELLARLRLPHDLTVLDLGTGTGALALALAERGHQVTGFDFSEKLLRRARRLVPNATFEAHDIIELHDVSDRSYDLVVMSYVLHGMSPALRASVLRAAARIAKRQVLVIDYRRSGNALTRLIEWVEGPHYFEFVKTPFSETLHACGLIVSERTKTRTGGGAWLCVPNPPVC